MNVLFVGVDISQKYCGMTEQLLTIFVLNAGEFATLT